MKLLYGVVLLVVVGCGTTPNPRSCLDGSCTDPLFPYCDVEGFIDQPGACLAVECAAGEVKGCREDRAITCNATGNNFDLVDCPHGCDVNGCLPPPEAVDCTTNAQCTNPAPICGAEMTCRGCISDDECTSTVCDLETGACTAEASIVYASPAGSSTADCSHTAPCTLARATAQASLSLGKTLRLLPGNYADDFSISGNVLFKVVASSAILEGSSTMSVTGGANVAVRGLTITTPEEFTLTCGDLSSAIPKSTLRLTDVTAGLKVNRCNVTMSGGAIVRGFGSSADATIEADGVRFSFPFPRLSGVRVAIRILNGVFESSSVTLGTDDTALPGSTLSVAFSTFVFTKPSTAQICATNSSGYERTQKFENNIFVATPDTNYPFAVLPRDCMFTNNIVFPQDMPVPGGNPVVDPQLVDIVAKDFRLNATSPALNVGLPSVGLSPSHDYDGVVRPQGAAPDLGAFERLP